MMPYKITNWEDYAFSTSVQYFLTSTKIENTVLLAYKLGNPSDWVVAFSFQAFFGSHVVFYKKKTLFNTKGDLFWLLMNKKKKKKRKSKEAHMNKRDETLI